MGDNIAELKTGGVIVRTIAAGQRLGFTKPEPAFAISTADRSAERDYIVLTRDEGVKVALAILNDEIDRTERAVRTPLHAKEHLRAIAFTFGVNIDASMTSDQ